MYNIGCCLYSLNQTVSTVLLISCDQGCRMIFYIICAPRSSICIRSPQGFLIPYNFEFHFLRVFNSFLQIQHNYKKGWVLYELYRLDRSYMQLLLFTPIRRHRNRRQRSVKSRSITTHVNMQNGSFLSHLNVHMLVHFISCRLLLKWFLFAIKRFRERSMHYHLLTFCILYRGLTWNFPVSTPYMYIYSQGKTGNMYFFF